MQCMQVGRAGTGSALRWPGGAEICRRGEPATSLLILDGWAAEVEDLSNGTRLLTALFLPGEICNLEDVQIEGSAVGLLALTDVATARIDRDLLDLSNLRRGQALIRRQWLVSQQARSAVERMAHLFCELAVRLSPDRATAATEFFLPLTQATLGQLLGLSPVHVNRTLQVLRRRHLVAYQRGVLRILDATSLRELALFDPGYLLPNSLGPSPSRSDTNHSGRRRLADAFN